MGFLSSIGGVLNDITGASSSTANSAKYAFQQQQAANAFSEKTMKNLHQWEADDLEAAGLNRALTLGANGTTHNASGTTASGTGTPANGMDVINSAVAMFNAKKAGEKINAEVSTTPSQINSNNAEASLKRQQAANLAASNPFIPQKEKANIAKTLADTDATKGGWTAKVGGTDLYKKYGYGIAGAALSAIPFLGTGYKLLKGARTAKGFGKFLNSVK